MSAQRYITRAPRSSGLADVLEILLDRGLVIDAYVRVSLLGIELLTIDLRVVIASVDTYLRFAEAVNRLDLRAVDESWSIGRLGEAKEEVAESAGTGAVEGGMEATKEKVGGGRQDEDADEDEERTGRGSGSRSAGSIREKVGLGKRDDGDEQGDDDNDGE